MKYYACRRDEFKSGEMRAIKAGSLAIVLVRKGDEFYALRDICPHQGVELVSGLLQGTMIPSEVGQYIYGREGEILRCPWHGWEFDVATGCSLHAPETQRVKSYQVTIEGDDVYVHVGRGSDPGHAGGTEQESSRA